MYQASSETAAGAITNANFQPPIPTEIEEPNLSSLCPGDTACGIFLSKAMDDCISAHERNEISRHCIVTPANTAALIVSCNGRSPSFRYSGNAQ
ncbi:hypothetical protein M8818_003250 [Zalaria obscura]|uniref:Uncharacterized protein n=1 Tax=Zalaria obscura TaxID=2024903 RepID=A0ACC3SHE1_9PEZI